MKIPHCLLLGVILSLCACSTRPEAPPPETTVSKELITYFERADYILVCQKRGRKLIVIDVLKGPQKTGQTFATYLQKGSDDFGIKTEETWTQLVVMLPNLSRLAYYEIDKSSRVDRFDAQNKKNRYVLLSDLKKHYKGRTK
jgi:hypothetical protein